jgi:hypothetical protein
MLTRILISFILIIIFGNLGFNQGLPVEWSEEYQLTYFYRGTLSAKLQGWENNLYLAFETYTNCIFFRSSNDLGGNWNSLVRVFPPHAVHVVLKIYDISGREIASIINGQLSMGKYQTMWEAEGMPSGIYFARLSAISCQLSACGGQSAVRKLVLLK